jgi:sigma-B regulation protein RsbU (phosphoserine phosphatase)
MPALSFSTLRRRLAPWAPSSRLGRFALYLLGIDLLLYAVEHLQQRIARSSAAHSSLGGWVTFLSIVLGFVSAILALRWFRNRVMWRLRNRLIVTYVFIGVIPVLLILAMALVAGYLFSGQFATFLVTSDLQSELRSLDAANATVTAEVAGGLRSGRSLSSSAAAIRGFRPDDPRLDKMVVTAAYRGQTITAGESAGNQQAIPIPAWAMKDFHGVASEQGKLYLRVMQTTPLGGDKLVVISSLPLDKALLERLATDTGAITLYPAGVVSFGNSGKQGVISVDVRDDNTPGTKGGGPTVKNKSAPPAQRPAMGSISGGVLPPRSSVFDRQVAFAAPFPLTYWESGEEANTVLQVNTRPSLLFTRLFSRVSEFGRIVEGVLVAIAIFFAIIELLAFLIGVGLTRTITRSVAELYRATQRINRGDLKHRIEVRSHDQLAALESSFNSMSESLEKLIAEHKEKERMESELAIAQEVQSQLFPRGSSDVESLEVHGFCRPARTVSGDYYDFLPLGPDRLVIAVGDISGKGISAALLMATVHSAVRAYEFGRAPAVAQMALAGAHNSSLLSAYATAALDGDFAPASVLSLLNRQLYRSTPAEKYATMFLAVYDGASRTLTYSNAGHLAPALIGSDGSIRRLDTPGLVVGLFDSQSYEEATATLCSGDILLAFSDGVTEPENEYGEFGEERLIQIVRENRRLPLERISEQITTAVSDWIGPGEQPDDVTVVLGRVR